eukprot:scaffold41741_cov15-Prasinocladus_malaysianus.AAC.2
MGLDSPECSSSSYGMGGGGGMSHPAGGLGCPGTGDLFLSHTGHPLSRRQGWRCPTLHHCPHHGGPSFYVRRGQCSRRWLKQPSRAGPARTSEPSGMWEKRRLL